MNYLQVYFQEVNQVYQGQNATEHSYRPALKRLMEYFWTNSRTRFR
jgi:hypothetical protein